MGDRKPEDCQPEGWTVEVKIRKNGRKDKSPAVVKKQKLATNETTCPVASNQKSEFPETEKDGKIPDSASTAECTPITEHSTDPSSRGTELSSSKLPEDKHSDVTQEKGDPVKSASIGLGLDSKSFETDAAKKEIKKTGISKYKKNKDVEVPRRASKRLAGIPLDPTPELKSTNRARRAATKDSSEIVTNAGEDSSSNQLNGAEEAKLTVATSEDTTVLPKSNKSNPPPPEVASPIKHALKEETGKDSDVKHGSAIISPHCNQIATECDGKIEAKSNDDDKPELPLDLPLGELWQDPCIAFAIKTLTGVPFDDSDSVKVASASNSSDFGGLTILEEHTRKEENDDGGSKKQGHIITQSLGNPTVGEEHAGETETSEKSDEKLGSVHDLPFSDAWADPCIEFAIKTLTGAIPLDYDMVIQDFLPPQEVNTTQQQVRSGLALPNVGEFCQTDLLCQQFGAPDTPLFNQAALVQPGLSHSHARNVNLGYSVGTGHQHGHVEDRRSNKF